MRRLRKVVHALTEEKLNKLVLSHENCGWKVASELRKFHNGIGYLVTFDPEMRTQ